MCFHHMQITHVTMYNRYELTSNVATCFYPNLRLPPHNIPPTTSAVGLWLFIRRGKQCLDFTVTVHFFHMIGCWIYNAHFPAALSWWLVNVACMALMAVIGEYLCMRTELRAIPVNTGPKSNLWRVDAALWHCTHMWGDTGSRWDGGPRGVWTVRGLDSRGGSNRCKQTVEWTEVKPQDKHLFFCWGCKCIYSEMSHLTLKIAHLYAIWDAMLWWF